MGEDTHNLELCLSEEHFPQIMEILKRCPEAQECLKIGEEKDWVECFIEKTKDKPDACSSLNTLKLIGIMKKDCPECTEVAPGLKSLGDLAVLVDADSEEGQTLIKEANINYFPTILVVDQEGEILGEMFPFESPEL